MHYVFKFIWLQKDLTDSLHGGYRNASYSRSAQAVLQQHKDKCLSHQDGFGVHAGISCVTGSVTQ